MAERTIPNEKAIIDEILRRKGSQTTRIPAQEMKLFKAKLGEEIQRAGSLRRAFVDELLRQLKKT